MLSGKVANNDFDCDYFVANLVCTNAVIFYLETWRLVFIIPPVVITFISFISEILGIIVIIVIHIYLVVSF